MTLYDTLGVPPDATPDAIKAAHRAKVKLYHPDAGGNPDAFAQIQKAYEVLSDPERRAHYDEHGEDVPGDNSSARARVDIAKMVMLLYDKLGDSMKTVDIWTAVDTAIRERMRDATDEAADLEEKRLVLVDLRDRFTTEDGLDNIGAGAMTSRIQGVEKRIRDIKADLEQGERMLDIIRKQAFRFDKPEPRHVTTTTYDDAFERQSFYNQMYGRPGSNPYT